MRLREAPGASRLERSGSDLLHHAERHRPGGTWHSGWCLAADIRKFVLQAHSLDELVALGTVTAQAARFLEAAVAAGLNILVSGGTQAGKTTLLNCLCAAIPARERVVTCEEVFELPKASLVHR